MAAINSQYIHTNPAVRSVAACCRDAGLEVSIVETTVNDSPASILAELYEQKADVYLFSCYIWNIDLARRICSDLKSAMGDIVIGAAGPQVSFHQEEFLRENPAIDLVLSGEGEETTPELLLRLQNGSPLSELTGLCFRNGGKIVTNPPARPVAMDSLPFAYTDLSGLDGRILYYESMRGCPFSCGYCLSGDGNTVRLRSLSLVFQDLRRFLDAGVKQVKLVDRTFNADKKHAVSVWEYLIANDNGVTNFHFELAGELLDDDMLALLKTARPGLFQFEIGVQSVNEKALREIRRPFDFETLARHVNILRDGGNIHIHLDLIAGLPHEDFTSFADSFNRVHRLRPNQLQLGFLKILPGSRLERDTEKYGIAYSRYAPFEVIRTNWLNYGELCALHGVAKMTDVYHNSGRFSRILDYILGHFDEPFACYMSLWSFYRKCGHDKSPLSKLGYYELLKPFMEENNIPVTERAKWLCKLDIVQVEKPRKLPSWVDVDLSRGYYHQILEFLGRPDTISRYLSSYDKPDTPPFGHEKPPVTQDNERNVSSFKLELEAKRLVRIVHVEILPFSPETGEDILSAMLFDYRSGKYYCLPVSETDGRIG